MKNIFNYGIGLRRAPKDEDPQWQKDTEYHCVCGGLHNDHQDGRWDCLHCGECEEYIPDESKPVEVEGPNPDTMPGGHDDY